jgi:carboxypeptidase Q
MKRIECALAASVFLFGATAAPAQPAGSDIGTKLRAAETQDSKVMWIMHNLTDVYGPRLTGSPQFKAAADWTVKTMSSWGLKNTHLEGWDFGHAGWHNELVEASITLPYQAPITARAMPWTPSTNGLVVAKAVVILPPGVRPAGNPRLAPGARPPVVNPGPGAPPMPAAAAPGPMPTQAELTAYLNSVKAKVKGAIVLVGPNNIPGPTFNAAPYRNSDAQWQQRANGGGRGGEGGGAPAAAPDRSRLTAGQIDAQVTKFLVDNGAVARVYDGGEEHAILRVQDVGGYNEGPQVPAVMVANSDYGRISRVYADGADVTMRLNVKNSFNADGKTAYNVVGEIPGTDKADEVVMIGGHFDSWAGATGATDDGAGSVVMLEAMRLLQQMGVKPRRTIRVALWGGEEQGIYGSQAYVKQHFGTAENPKPEHAKLNAYINVDGGTGIVRSSGVFGPPAAAATVGEVLSQFKDWGFAGSSPSSSRSIGGTDSTSFNYAGLAGIGLGQDPFDYGSYTHHTQYDTYETIYEPDMRSNAIIVATLAYALAMSDAPLARFDKSNMPPIGKVSEVGERTLPFAQRGKPPQ